MGLAGFGGDTGGSFRASAGGGGRGRAAMAMVQTPVTPRQVITEKSVANALRVLMAVGGSTQCRHSPDGGGGARWHQDFLRLAERNIRQHAGAGGPQAGGGWLYGGFFSAGGVGAVLRELKPLLHLDTLDVEGRSAGRKVGGKARLGGSQGDP